MHDLLYSSIYTCKQIKSDLIFTLQVYFDKYSDLKSEYNSNKDMFISNMDDSDRKEYQRYLRDCRKYTREKKRKKEGDVSQDGKIC